MISESGDEGGVGAAGRLTEVYREPNLMHPNMWRV